MPGRVLVVENVATDGIVMKVKLGSACYDVVIASDPADGLRLARSEAPCLVVISAELGTERQAAPDTVPAPPVGMPAGPAWASPAARLEAGLVPVPVRSAEMNAVGLCRRLRGHPSTASVPIIVVTRHDATEARLALLEAGADEVLLKPLEERFLLARIRSLLRSRDEINELRLRESTSRVLGFSEGPVDFAAPGTAVLVSPEATAGGRLRRALERHLSDRLSVVAPGAILNDAQSESAPDVFVVDASDRETAQRTLSILPELRARTESRHAAIIVLTAPGEEATAILALDLGANDVAPAPGDPAELALRVRKQIRWKQGRDRLRQTVRDGLHAAITDPLTGLYNRRYALPHLARIADTARESGRRFAVLLADLDHFKRVNDTYGHGAGDAVLVETARRMRENLRSMDLVARIGGEEFLVAMPDTGLDEARVVAERLCGIMREQPIVLPDGLSITVTMSMGLAMGQEGEIDERFGGGEAAARHLMEAADQALYGAKSGGRAQYCIGSAA